MINNVGDIVYKYTLRNGTIYVHKGIIIEHGNRKRVYFKDTGNTVTALPKECEFGVIRTPGPNLWLTEENSELARRLFIEHEEDRLAEVTEEFNRLTKMVELLKSRGI